MPILIDLEGMASECEIHSLDGRMIRKLSIVNGRVNTLDLSAGIYLLRVEDSHGQWYVRKVVKL